jgi:hypothetical protein
MPEGLKTPDGNPFDLDKEFARAMATPTPDEPLADKPPKAEPKAPPRARAKRDTPRVEKTPPKPTGKTTAELAKQRTDGIKGVVQLTAVLPLMAYQRTGKKAFMADTVTLTRNADALADACVQTAAVSPGFAKLIDSVTNVGPYAALCGVVVSITAQLAANHGMAVGHALGASDPADLIAEFEAEHSTEADGEAHPASP